MPIERTRRITGLRSIAVEVPDVRAAERFYAEVWLLTVVARTPGAVYLAGAGADHHLLSVHAGGSSPHIRHVTLRASSAAVLELVARDVHAAGGRLVAPLGPSHDPAAGMSITICDPDGRVIHIVHGDRVDTGAPVNRGSGAERSGRDRPIRLAHVVLNCREVASIQRFFEKLLGFRVSDRTQAMAFLNTNADHHSIALADADDDALNHIAFLVDDIDGVMRGIGRMRDAGHAVQWGPGRHGPGDNAFAYFLDPFGVVVEYTAEVAQIDDDHPVGSPGDWGWPAGRLDQWGVSAGPSDELRAAQRRTTFARRASP